MPMAQLCRGGFGGCIRFTELERQRQRLRRLRDKGREPAPEEVNAAYGKGTDHYRDPEPPAKLQQLRDATDTSDTVAADERRERLPEGACPSLAPDAIATRAALSEAIDIVIH